MPRLRHPPAPGRDGGRAARASGHDARAFIDAPGHASGDDEWENPGGILGWALDMADDDHAGMIRACWACDMLKITMRTCDTDEVLDWEARERCVGVIMDRLGVSRDDVVWTMVMDDTLKRCHWGLAFHNRTPMDAMAPGMPIARMADDVVSRVLDDMNAILKSDAHGFAARGQGSRPGLAILTRPAGKARGPGLPVTEAPLVDERAATGRWPSEQEAILYLVQINDPGVDRLVQVVGSVADVAQAIPPWACALRPSYEDWIIIIRMASSCSAPNREEHLLCFATFARDVCTDDAKDRAARFNAHQIEEDERYNA